MMTWTMLLAAVAAWLLMPARDLRRLGPDAPTLRWGRWGRADAYPWQWRAAASLLAAMAVALLIPELPLLPLLVGLGGYVGSGYVPRIQEHDDEARELPDALDFLAVCLEAGAPSAAAVQTVADVSPPTTATLLRRVLAHLEVGRTAEEAWAELRDHPIWGLPARDLVRSARSGTSLVTTLRLHADDARIAARDRATKRARKVGVKSVLPLMACFLPAFVLIGVVPIIASLLGRFLG